jgi:hypothetical protein
MPNNRRRTLRKNNRRGTLRKNNRRRTLKKSKQRNFRKKSRRKTGKMRKRHVGGVGSWRDWWAPAPPAPPAPPEQDAEAAKKARALEAATKAVADAEARVVELTATFKTMDDRCKSLEGGPAQNPTLHRANQAAAHQQRASAMMALAMGRRDVEFEEGKLAGIRWWSY